MTLIALIALAFAMSMDAFAAAVVQGANKSTINLRIALQTGIIFGTTEAITPILGYFIGTMAHAWVKTFDHWLSFLLLTGIGLHLLYETFFEKSDDKVEPKHVAFGKMALTAIATSIDAMVVGVSLAFLGANIWLSATLIGGATFLMTSLGVALGAKLGEQIGTFAQIFGALVLIGLGGFILISHLNTH